MTGSIVRRFAVPFSVALLLAVSATSSFAAPDPGVWSGPVVYAGEKAGPIAIPESDSVLTTIASLSVPVGKWVAFAKFDGHVPAGAAGITCDLVAGSGASQTRQRGYSRIGLPTNEEPGAGNVSLNLEHTFTDQAGKFRLRCQANSEGVTAHFVRIMAMRVGSLTKRSLAAGTTTTAGSALPKVVHAFRNGALAIPDSDAFVPIATMPLPAGKWWIRADFSVVQTAGFSTPARYACQLLSGGQKDAVSGELELVGDATMVDFNVAAAVTPRRTLDDIRLSCQVDKGGPSDTFEARDIRITAINLGTLTQVVFTNGSSSTSGSGKPVAIHGQRFLAPDLTSTYASLGQISLSSGKWMVSAKVSSFAGHTIQCRLRDGVDTDEAYEEFPEYGRTMAMQIADSSTARRRQLSIDCRDPLGPEIDPTEVRYVKVTALRLATLVLRDL